MLGGVSMGGGEDTFAYSSFFPLLFACCLQEGSLIMFLVVFTNVSFIKRQPAHKRHHPSAKVEVIIALNHLTVYLFGWLSAAEGGQPLLAPGGERLSLSFTLFLSILHSYSSILLSHLPLLHLFLSFFLSFFMITYLV